MALETAMDGEIVLDLSRLLSRVLHPTPTGVDRVEMAYARGLAEAMPDRLHFAAVHPSGIYGRLPHRAVARFLDLTEERWEHRGFTSIWDMRRFAAGAFAALRPRLPRRHAGARRPIYIQASPNNLVRQRTISRILAYERARFVCLVHDLIPLEYPEYAREGGAAEHRARVSTIVTHAEGIVTNSHATMRSIEPWIARSGRMPATAVAHLGTHVHRSVEPFEAPDGRPYFVSVGTIEPRKNHLLLLNLWRRMAEERGPDAVPRLLLIGRRGWENEQVVDMLERCPALQGCVEEQGRLTDREVSARLAGSSGLLMPSFAEGYGMPVTEALALRVPVVCSDLPALREAGGDVPEFLDPLDGPAWQRTVEELSQPQSRIRAAQALRLAGWRPPTWQDHIAILLDLLHRLPA